MGVAVSWHGDRNWPEISLRFSRALGKQLPMPSSGAPIFPGNNVIMPGVYASDVQIG